MPPRDSDVAAAQTAIAFITKGIDRLEDALLRLENTVREDFAPVVELEYLKEAITTLRTDIDRRLVDMEKSVGDKLSAHAKATTEQRDSDIKIAKWFIRVAIPLGSIAILKFVWDVWSNYVKKLVVP